MTKKQEINSKRKVNKLINQFNLATNERKREKLIERIGEYGWN